MRLARLILGSVALSATAFGTAQAAAPDFPLKPVRIVTSEPGGGLDFASRMIAQGVTGSLGQPVIVENRGGAGGLIAIESVVKAQPDGYTLLLYGSTIWLVPFLREHAGYDPVKDLTPVIMATNSPNIVVVTPSLPVHSMKELIALAKAKPGALNYGSGALGASSHLSVELFKSMAGVDIVRVPYKGTGPALIGLAAGQVQVMFGTTGGVPLIKAGKIRALAVTSPKPSALFPDLPTVADSGLPGYQSGSQTAIFAPAKTPAARINRLNREIAHFLLTPDAKVQMANQGVEPVASTPQELAATMKAEMTRLGKVIKDAGIKEE